MPLDLVQLQEKRAPVTVEYAGESVTIYYRPHVYTNPLFARLQQLKEHPSFDPMVEVLSQLIIDWDITSGGKPIKPSAEVIGQLDIVFLMRINEAIMADIISPKNEKTSSSSS